MSIIVTYKLIDSHEMEKEFFALSAVGDWVSGIGQDMFDYILIEGENDAFIDNMQTLWDMIHTIKDDANCTQHSYFPTTNDLSVCGPACNCMKCNPSKSSCIALRASELNLPHIDSSTTENVEPVPFSELPDGALFYNAATYAYGSRIKLQKTLEDGGNHNAVHVVNTNIVTLVPDDAMVIPA